MEPDPNDEPTRATTGGAVDTGASQGEGLTAVSTAGEVAGGPVGDDGGTDEAALDLQWGFGPSEPLVGHGAPPVVAVMVTCDPGDWFEATLRSLADQDYGNLAVLVIDNGSVVDPTPRIAEVLPTAYVRRLGEDEGFSAAANDALTAVEGAAFHLVLHDDVRLAPDAVTSLVSEAFRANAGIVGPKLVDWDDRTRLMSVGYSVDPYGFPSSISDPGELDQSQHDSARAVFAVSDACMLIRADLFRVLGGFSEDIPFFGEDIDLCWRAHVAAATVQYSPNAVVAHRGRFEQRRVAENRGRLELRHQGRMMLANYEPFRVLRLVPLAMLLSLLDLIGSLVLGRFQRAGDVVAAWGWNIAKLPALVGVRSRVKRYRRAHDADYLPLMRQGSSRIASLVRADEGENRLQSAAVAGRGYLKELTSGTNRSGISLAVVAGLLFLVGMRDLFTGPLPVIRELFDAGENAGRLLSEWWTGWRDAGLGEASEPPLVVPALGVAGTVLFGSVGLARRLLIILPLLVGALGAWKLFLRSGSTRARAAALAAYGLNPVVLNAVAEGRLGALVTYGAAPWVLRRSARSAGIEPFAGPGEPALPFVRSAAGTALMLAAVAAVTPLGAGLLVAALVLAALVGALFGLRPGAGRMATHVLAAAVLALPIVLPWILRAAISGDASSLTGLHEGRVPSAGAADLITGNLGPISVGLFGWGLIVAAAYSLLAGRSWRFGWAVAGWAVSFASWIAAALLAQADMLAGAGPELVLIPAVLGLAVSLAMGALAFEHDVVGSDFGLPQILSGVAVLALLVGLVPVGVAAADGRWYQPEGDFRRVLRLVDDGDAYRTVWLGDADVLPLAGWDVDGVEGLSVATSSGLDPTVTQRYRLGGTRGEQMLSEAVGAALAGETTRLGRLLAPMGVRYVVAVQSPAPQPFVRTEVPLPAGTLAALREQLDLAEIDLNPGMAVFEVSDPWPLRFDLDGAGPTEDAERSLSQLLQAPVERPAPLLSAGAGPGTRFSGTVPADSSVGQSLEADPGWSLTVDGTQADRGEILGWAQRYGPTDGGRAVLAWGTPLTTRLLQVVQIAGLIAVVIIASHRRRLVTHARRQPHTPAGAPIVVVRADEGDAVAPGEHPERRGGHVPDAGQPREGLEHGGGMGDGGSGDDGIGDDGSGVSP